MRYHPHLPKLKALGQAVAHSRRLMRTMRSSEKPIRAKVKANTAHRKWVNLIHFRKTGEWNPAI